MWKFEVFGEVSFVNCTLLIFIEIDHFLKYEIIFWLIELHGSDDLRNPYRWQFRNCVTGVEIYVNDWMLELVEMSMHCMNLNYFSYSVEIIIW